MGGGNKISHGAFGRLVNHRLPPSPPPPHSSGPTTPAGQGDDPTPSASDWVKRGHVTSAGPIRNSRVTETLQRVFLGLWGWGLRRESSGMPEVESVAAGSGPPGLPRPVCHFPKREAHSVLLGPLTCEVGPMTASPQGAAGDCHRRGMSTCCARDDVFIIS